MTNSKLHCSLLSKLATLMFVSCVSMQVADARYSRMNMQSAFDDYASSFKTKEFDLKLEENYEVDSDLL